ncbi:hypothetical protein B0H14DRAFT_2615835 [Mycena olivaceomarginata]|nr:hypothetical protein B0H14DRAFT_2615835 [Mycena olivaceomarginata]
MQSDMDIIITVNPDLAEQVHDASWIMVDTTFPVVHGTMNEWKLLIWLNGLDKNIPLNLFGKALLSDASGNRATREAFVIVWNGIFEAIKLITGKSRNFKVFSKSSSLLGAIGDSEGAQAQGLGDVIILRQMNTRGQWNAYYHRRRGVFKLEAYVEEYIFHSLLGFFLTSKLWRKLKIIAISARIQQTPNILAGLGPQEIEAQALRAGPKPRLSGRAGPCKTLPGSSRTPTEVHTISIRWSKILAKPISPGKIPGKSVLDVFWGVESDSEVS